MSWLLALYPRAWRRRYGQEMEAHLSAEPRSFRTALDLIAGAVDAWLNPRWIPGVTQGKGEQSMIQLSRCGSAAIPTGDKGHGAVWMIAVTLGLTLLYFALLGTFGHHTAVQALLYAAFPIAYSVSSLSVRLKQSSRGARTAMVIASAVAWYAFFLAVTALSAAI